MIRELFFWQADATNGLLTLKFHGIWITGSYLVFFFLILAHRIPRLKGKVGRLIVTNRLVQINGLLHIWYYWGLLSLHFSFHRLFPYTCLFFTFSLLWLKHQFPYPEPHPTKLDYIPLNDLYQIFGIFPLLISILHLSTSFCQQHFIIRDVL